MSLYLDHFGLAAPPFRITPDTDFFFPGAKRGPTLDALIYAITQDEGIVKVTGEVGSGKTMLCRMLLERLPCSIETLYLANPSLSRHEIIGALADELGIPCEGTTTHSLTRALQNALIDRFSQGKKVVLLIDEAHAMPAESLEEIRLLSNLESRASKLLQIALFAQPELDKRLEATDMRQLRERITQQFTLAPLQGEDVAAYLEFRMRSAGYKGPLPFTTKATRQITRLSEGLSRRINILADKSLLAAFANKKHLIDNTEVAIAAKDAAFKPLQPGLKSQFNRQFFLTGLIAIILFTAAIAAVVIMNNQLPTIPSAPPHRSVQSLPSKTSVPDPQAESPKPSGVTPLTRLYQAQFENWITTAPLHHFFIQLYSSDARQIGEIEGFLAHAQDVLPTKDIRVYRSSLSGRDRIGVIYGEFPTREEAFSAMLRLPESIKASQPFPRSVSKLH